jgi:glycerate-2-kinase
MGGRNQELALSFKLNTHLLSNVSLNWLPCNSLNSSRIVFTSFGTDGIDGPTDAAGAIVSSPFKNITENDLSEIQRCLEQHNSYKYFENKDELIKIGHTGTNVSDLQILLIDASL